MLSSMCLLLLPSICLHIKCASDEYYMKHESRGYAVIINNENFADGLLTRPGSRKDTEDMKSLLRTLGFQEDNIEIYCDVSAEDIGRRINKVAAKDYTDCDCFVCVILSHGRDDGDDGILSGNRGQGTILGSDGTLVRTSQLIAGFKQNQDKNLKGKPKIFFIQSCRGHKVDQGVMKENETDNPTGIKILAKISDENEELANRTDADFLIAHSSVHGYYSWSVPEGPLQGSWFIQTMVHVISTYWTQQDLVSLLTEANRQIACKEDQHEDKRVKAIFCIYSMLTKKLFFRTR